MKLPRLPQIVVTYRSIPGETPKDFRTFQILAAYTDEQEARKDFLTATKQIPLDHRTGITSFSDYCALASANDPEGRVPISALF